MKKRWSGLMPIILAGLVGSVWVVSCRPEDQRTETVDPTGTQTRAQLPPQVVAQLDSGTAAYREEDYEGALVHYAKATELAPEAAAGWFGVYMVQHRLGRAEEADRALARAQEAAPGASLIHPTAADTILR